VISLLADWLLCIPAITLKHASYTQPKNRNRLQRFHAVCSLYTHRVSGHIKLLTYSLVLHLTLRKLQDQPGVKKAIQKYSCQIKCLRDGGGWTGWGLEEGVGEEICSGMEGETWLTEEYKTITWLAWFGRWVPYWWWSSSVQEPVRWIRGRWSGTFPYSYLRWKDHLCICNTKHETNGGCLWRLKKESG